MAACGSWQKKGTLEECGPLPPSWAPWQEELAGKVCGNGCLGFLVSQGCCNHFCLQTLAVHLEFAGTHVIAQSGMHFFPNYCQYLLNCSTCSKSDHLLLNKTASGVGIHTKGQLLPLPSQGMTDSVCSLPGYHLGQTII